MPGRARQNNRPTTPSPATPPPGSSPVTPPGGSPPRQGYTQRPPPPSGAGPAPARPRYVTPTRPPPGQGGMAGLSTPPMGARGARPAAPPVRPGPAVQPTAIAARQPNYYPQAPGRGFNLLDAVRNFAARFNQPPAETDLQRRQRLMQTPAAPIETDTQRRARILQSGQQVGTTPGQLGMAALTAALPPVAGIVKTAQTINDVLNNPEKVAQDIRSPLSQLTTGPVAERILQIPGNINKPVTAEEAQAASTFSAPAGVTAEAKERMRQEAATQATENQAEGTEADLGLKVRRAGGEILSAVGDILSEPLNQTTGRLIGTMMNIESQAREQHEQGAITGTMATPYGQANIREQTAPDIDYAKAFMEGRETYLRDVPWWAQAAISFSPLDPLAWFAGAAKSERFVKNATEAVQDTLIASDKTLDETMAAARLGEAFQSQPLARAAERLPVVGGLFRRTPETNSMLLAQNALTQTAHFLTAGTNPADWTEIMGVMGKYAAGDASWVDDAAKFPALARHLADEQDAARLAKLGLKAGDVISPLESNAGQMATAVVKQVMDMGGTGRMGALVETIADGFKPGATPEMVAAAKKADVTLLQLFSKASDELAGVKPAEGLAGAAKTAEKALSEYQGLFSRYFQLNTVGFGVRNATNSITQGLSDGVISNVPKGFYENQWGGALGPPLAIRRGTGGAIAEQGGELGKFLNKQGKVGEIAAKVLDAPATIARKTEDAFAQMAHYTGVDWLFKNTIRSPRVRVIPAASFDAVVASAGPEAAKLLESAAKGAWNPAEIDDAVKAIAGGEAWRVIPPEYADFAANHPDVSEIVRTANSPEDLRTLFRDWEAQKIQDITGYRTQLPPNDAYEAELRKGLLADGWSGQRLEDEVRRVVNFRQQAREGKVLAQSWAYDAVNNLPTNEAKVEWLKKFRQLESKFDTEQATVAAQADRIRRQAGEFGGDWFDEVQKLWRDTFKKEEEAWHLFREQMDDLLPDEARIPKDVAQAVTSKIEIQTSTAQEMRDIEAAAKARAGIGEAGAGIEEKLKYSEATQAAMTPEEKLRYQMLSQAEEQLPMTAPDAPPDPAMVKKYGLPAEVRDARRLRMQIEKNWGNKYENLSDEALAAVQKAAGEAKARVLDVRNAADKFGTFLRDATFYNYGDKRQFDNVLKMGFAYPYWYTREMASTARRLFQNPHMIYAMNNLRSQLEEHNATLPQWMRDNLTMTTQDGSLLSFPILNNIDPANFMYRQNFKDEEMAKDPAGRAFMTLNEFGPGSTNMAMGHTLGVLAAAAGKPDLAYSYAQSFGTTSKLIYGLTGMAPESAVAGLPNSPFARTMVQGPNGPMFVGFKYDRAGLVKAMVAMKDEGRISPEKYEQILNIINDPYNEKYAQDPSYVEAWDIYQKALEEKRQADLPRTLISWFGGPAGRFYTGTDLEIMQSQTAYGQLVDGLKAKGASDEEWAQAMSQFWNDPAHADYDNYVLGKKQGVEADQAYSWSVLSRVPPGRTQYDILEKAGVSKELLDEFYAEKGIPSNWTKQDYDEFMRGVASLGAALSMPDAPTLDEWKVARERQKELQNQLNSQFGEEAVDVYRDWQASGYDKTFAERNPIVNTIDQFKAQYVMNDTVDGKKILAAYYASNATVETYLHSKFREENYTPEIGIWQGLKAQAALGDEAAKSALSRYERQHRELITAYKAAEKEFKGTLDDEIARLEETLPDVKVPEARGDLLSQSMFTEGAMGAIPGQATTPTLPENGEAATTSSAVDMLVDAERERMSSDPNVLTSDNRQNYEDLLYDEIFSQVNYDPEASMDRFYATHPGGWKVYPSYDTPQELQKYMAGNTMLREAILADTGNKWTQVLAYVRTLTPQQLAELRKTVPDIEWVAAHAGRWDDGPSEAARSDVVGINVAFNQDGTISISRMTNKEYFGGHSQPGTLGGGTGGASGGTGGAPQERYYTPRRRQRRGGGGGYSGGGDYAQAPQAQAGGGEWESAMQQFSSRPDFLVQLQDFLALSDYEGQSLLQRFPDLALYISQLSPEQIARLRQGYLAWASATGRLSTTQAARQNANPGMSLRVYGRRSGRSGLTG